MKHYLFVCLATALAIVTTTSCKKKKEGCTDPVSVNYDSAAEVYDGSCQYGGLGGNVTIKAKPQHHGAAIISGSQGHPDSVFIKFNAIESPGTSPAAYNLQREGIDGDDGVRIAGLKPGKYFIYMTGYDSTSNEFVKGGIPYVITATEGSIDVLIPVKE